MDRQAWRAAVRGVGKSQTRWSDWTETETVLTENLQESFERTDVARFCLEIAHRHQSLFKHGRTTSKSDKTLVEELKSKETPEFSNKGSLCSKQWWCWLRFIS